MGDRQIASENDKLKIYREYLEGLALNYATTVEAIELAVQAFADGCPGLLGQIQEHVGGSSLTLVDCIKYVSCLREDQIMDLLLPIRQEGLKALVGMKVTIWGKNDFGFGWSIKAKLVDVDVVDHRWGQYRVTMKLVFRPYRARKDRRMIINKTHSLVIWQGWHEVDTEIWGPAKETRHGGSIAGTRHDPFSDAWMNQALGSVEAEPFFIQGRKDQ